MKSTDSKQPAVQRAPAPQPVKRPDAPRTRVTRRDLMLEIHTRRGLPREETLQIINLFTANITEHLAAGNDVKLPKFGRFRIVRVKSKTGRNPKDPAKPVPIAARAVVRFRPGREMKRRALLLTPEA